MIALHDNDVHMASQTQTPVLITAASRERREMCARLIHARGRGGGPGPFVAYEVNGSRPKVAASVTAQYGADESNTLRHHFAQAVGGSLFIEDVAALTSGEQAELFSLLHRPPDWSERPQARRAVRVIAGASRHLDSERASGAFSEPLFYRLNVIHVDLLDQQEPEGVSMKARDLMTTPVQACRPDTDLAAVTKLMWDHDCGFIPVVDASGTVTGVITDRDICIATATRRLLPEHIAATQAMTRQVRACLPDDSVSDVLNAMKTSRIRRLPVIDDQGHLQGVISMNDIVIAAADSRQVPATEIVAAMANICAHRSVAAVA
jgi:CBS domain-containing protein